MASKIRLCGFGVTVPASREATCNEPSLVVRARAFKPGRSRCRGDGARPHGVRELLRYGKRQADLVAGPVRVHAEPARPGRPTQWLSLDRANEFSDPQLPGLIAEALEGSPSITQPRARLAKASSYIESSRSAQYPKVNCSSSWTRKLFSANALYPPRTAPCGGTWYSENNVLASASWNLDLWGKNRQRLGQAGSQEKAAEADMQQARVTLAASIASTYNQLAQLYASRDIAARKIANRQDIGRITNGCVSAGLDTNVERQTANSNIATSQANLTDLDGQITAVRYQLGALLGKGPDRGLQIAQPTLSRGDAVAVPDNLTADLVARRADIVAARWQVEAAMHEMKEAKAGFFPDISSPRLPTHSRHNRREQRQTSA